VIDPDTQPYFGKRQAEDRAAYGQE